MAGEDNIWSALTEPLGSLFGNEQDAIDNIKRAQSAESRTNKAQQSIQESRFCRRIKSLQTEVDEVTEEATKTRKTLWETQDRLTEKDEKIRELENHLNEVLQMRDNDLVNIKQLRVANSDCVENENRAQEAMEVFKKCYKRTQLKIKEHEEEIAVLREQVKSLEWAADESKVLNTGMVNESALEYIQQVSNSKEKKLKDLLSQSESDAELWKSKYKVANKRCTNWQEQILMYEHQTEGGAHIKKQRIKIQELEHHLRTMKENEERARKDLEGRNPFNGIMKSALCDSDAREGLATSFMENFPSLNCNFPSLDDVPNCDDIREAVPDCNDVPDWKLETPDCRPSYTF